MRSVLVVAVAALLCVGGALAAPVLDAEAEQRILAADKVLSAQDKVAKSKASTAPVTKKGFGLSDREVNSWGSGGFDAAPAVHVARQKVHAPVVEEPKIAVSLPATVAVQQPKVVAVDANVKHSKPPRADLPEDAMFREQVDRVQLPRALEPKPMAEQPKIVHQAVERTTEANEFDLMMPTHEDHPFALPQENDLKALDMFVRDHKPQASP